MIYFFRSVCLFALNDPFVKRCSKMSLLYLVPRSNDYERRKRERDRMRRVHCVFNGNREFDDHQY